MPPKPSPTLPTWDNLPPTRQQELTHLLASLLTQYLTTHKRQTAPLPPQELPNEQPPQNS